MFTQQVEQRKLRNFYLRCALIVLYVALGLVLDDVGETRSLTWFATYGGTLGGDRLWYLLYPLYWLCRAQCFICYLLSILLPYVIGLLVHIYLTRFLLGEIMIVQFNGGLDFIFL